MGAIRPYTAPPESAEAPSRSGPSILPFALGGVALLVVSAGVTLVVVRGRRSRQPARAAPAPLPTLPAAVVPRAQRPVQTRLVVGGDSARPTVVSLTGGSLLIGRGQGCDLVLADHLASRQHAKVEYRDGVWLISDLHSTNGTWINGLQVYQQVLERNDQIQIGSTVLVFQSE